MSVKGIGLGLSGRPGKDGLNGTNGKDGVNGTNGTNGTNGLNGTNGKDGIVPVYGSAGLIASPKIWTGSVTLDASGNFSANISSAGFTAPPVSVHLTGKGSTQTAAQSVNPFYTSKTATAIVGSATVPVTLLALGLTNAKAPAGTVIEVTAIGI